MEICCFLFACDILLANKNFSFINDVEEAIFSFHMKFRFSLDILIQGIG